MFRGFPNKPNQIGNQQIKCQFTKSFLQWWTK